jgi:hypothetical protein
MSAAASVTIDPAGALERLGAELPNLLGARARTRDAVAARREAVSALPLDGAASVVLFGSWGRGELTRGSDDDWAILVDRAADADAAPAPADVAAALEGGRGPGRSGVFGTRILWPRATGWRRSTRS